MDVLQMFFCLMWFHVGSVAATDDQQTIPFYQEGSFVAAQTGDSITLRCFFEAEVAVKYYWYKQTLGQKPRLLSTFYKYQTNATFHNEFLDNPRFSVDAEKSKNHLTITDLRLTDSATYYCASSYSYKFEIAEGTIVDVKGSSFHIQALVQQLESGTVRPGRPVTLNCTVTTGTCDEEHSVYWFKVSGESHAGLLYTDPGGGNCSEKNPEATTQSCVYTLAVPSPNQSHAGTYYCAVASCGRIVFGIGTRLDFEQDLPPTKDEENSTFLLYIVSAAVPFLITATFLFMCVILQGLPERCGRSRSDPSTRNSKDEKNKNVSFYTAGGGANDITMETDDTWSECVYFRKK